MSIIRVALFATLGIFAFTSTSLASNCHDEAGPTAEAKGEKHQSTEIVPYPFDYCPISKEKLGAMGEPERKVYGNQEVRFCCAGCIPTFEEKLEENLKPIKEAAAKASSDKGKEETGTMHGHGGQDH